MCNCDQDPVNRFVSKFEYSRRTTRIKNNANFYMYQVRQMEPFQLENMTFTEWMDLSLEQCVIEGVRECDPRDFDIIDTQIVNLILY